MASSGLNQTIDVPVHQLQAGDYIVAATGDNGCNWTPWGVDVVPDSQGHSWKCPRSLAHNYKDVTFRIRRKVPVVSEPKVRVSVRGTGFPEPKAEPKIPDWPSQCPRCRRAESAVLLFQSWDCRHGCFK